MTASLQRTTPVVIKVGGSFFNELATHTHGAKNLLHTIATLQQANVPVVVVHGGGEQVLERMAQLNITSTRKEGLRISPDEHMPIVTGVLAGELNKQLVAQSTKFGINAVGISLADGNIATCSEHPANIGAVGIPRAQDSALFDALFSANIVPFVASIGKDENGRLYNVNADHAAICVAELLDTQLYFFADVKGVLDENKQLIPELNTALAQKLITQNVITDGMVIKVKAAQDAANQIQQAVTIASWDNAEYILVQGLRRGTQILPAPVNA